MNIKYAEFILVLLSLHFSCSFFLITFKIKLCSSNYMKDILIYPSNVYVVKITDESLSY